MASKAKTHIKKEYKGRQIDIYFSEKGYWYGFVENRVHPEFRTGNCKSRLEVIDKCKVYIDSN